VEIIITAENKTDRIPAKRGNSNISLSFRITQNETFESSQLRLNRFIPTSAPEYYGWWSKARLEKLNHLRNILVLKWRYDTISLVYQLVQAHRPRYFD
tara:strand:+ start:301 stop:594 length:294 start_codon:yes stop_codon:yes gene_type:complete